MKLVIPQKLHDEILKIKFRKLESDKVFTFLNFLLKQYLFKKDNLDTDFIEIDSNDLRDYYTKTYKKLFLSTLIRKRIIIVDPYYNHKYSDDPDKTIKDNKFYGYKINPDLLDFTRTVVVDYKPFKSKEKKKHDAESNRRSLPDVVQDLSLLSFDLHGMWKQTKSFNTNPLVVLNSNIKSSVIELKIKKDTHTVIPMTISTKKAIRMAISNGKDLIQYKGEYYIEKYQDFKDRKESAKKKAGLYIISKLLSGDFYAKRNDTNFRLDTNLTNMESAFFKSGLVKLDGQILTDIDLKNSQPSLLCYLLQTFDQKDHPLNHVISGFTFPALDMTLPDVTEFIEFASSGTLYERIGSTNNIERDIAKRIMIRVLFSKSGWRGQAKKNLQKCFPSIIKWTDQFKKLNGETSIAILLQKTESAIFIDDLYTTLRAEGYKVFSKHDSILCKESQREEIKKRMEALLDKYGFNYRLS